jgi:hypothetical protein
MFRRCNVPGGVNDGRGVRDSSPATLALNVSAECKVAAYVLGDLGRNGQTCSQEPAAHAVAAYYTSPATLAGIGATKGLQAPWRVGLLGALDAAGLAATFFAVGTGARVPDVIARPAELQLTVRRRRATERAVLFCVFCGHALVSLIFTHHLTLIHTNHNSTPHPHPPKAARERLGLPRRRRQRPGPERRRQGRQL